MSSILPDAGTGAIPYNDGGAVNAYIIPPEFSTSCAYTVLPNSCEARILPSQINALVSEMLALMVAFDPDGNFDCTQVNNMATNFTVYAGEVSGLIGSLDTRVSALEGSGIPGLMSAYATGVAGTQNITQNANPKVTDWLPPTIPNGGVTYSAGVFTIVTSGMWTISSYLNVGPATILETISIYINGVLAAATGDRSDNGLTRQVSVATTAHLAPGDTVEVHFNVEATSGGTFNFVAGRFTMARLGD